MFWCGCGLVWYGIVMSVCVLDYFCVRYSVVCCCLNSYLYCGLVLNRECGVVWCGDDVVWCRGLNLN